MKRTWLATAVTAAAVTALTLSACGSSPSAGPTGSATSGQQSSVSSSSAETTAEAGGATDETSGEASTEPSAPSSSTTVTVSGDLDAQSAAWFSTVCTGMTPLIEQVFTLMGSAMGAGADPDPAKMQKELVGTLSGMSSTLSDAARSIGAMPPPTVANGTELAAKIVEALKTTAPKMKEAADRLAAAKVSNAEQLEQAMGSIETLMGSGMDGLSLDEYELDPKIEEAMKNLPACAPLYSFEQSAAPTS